MFKLFSTSQLSAGVEGSYTLSGKHVEITKQPTGFGSKRLFICPTCGDRRAKLVILQNKVFCRGCAPFNIYRQRQNLYDEGGYDLIVWYMRKIAGAANIPIKWPFKYYSHVNHLIGLPPKKYEAFRATLIKLQMLENMRFAAIFFNRTFTAAQIKEFISPAFTSRFTLWQMEHYCIFTGRYSPYKAREMMREAPTG